MLIEAVQKMEGSYSPCTYLGVSVSAFNSSLLLQLKGVLEGECKDLCHQADKEVDDIISEIVIQLINARCRKISFFLIEPLFNKSVKNKFLFTMMAYPCQTRTTLGQLCTAHGPDVMQPGFEPGTAVTPLALRCSALDRCATREP